MYNITEEDYQKKPYMILSSISDGLISVDEDGIIEFINESAQEYTGWNHRDAIGKPIDTVFNIIDSKTREKKDCFFEDIEIPCDRLSFSDCPILISKDGREIYIAPSVAPIKDNIGKPQGMTISFRDVTHHKHTEDQLKIERNNLKMQFQYSPVPMIVVDKNSVVQDVNDSFIDFLEIHGGGILGERLEEVLGCIVSISDIEDENKTSSRCYIKNCIKEVLQSKIPFRDIERKYKFSQDERENIYFLKLSYIPININNDTNVLVSIYDITEEKENQREMERAVKEAKEANKAKSEFLANMSHEIRTPLNGIIGMLDLTMLTELSHDQQDNLLIAKNCANSLLSIINDVLDFSKMEAGRFTIEKINFDLKTLVERIMKAHYIHARKKGIELTYQIPLGLPHFIQGDSNRLQQILNNLLSNGIKFTEEGYVSLIIKTIENKKGNIKLEFSVIDTGVGIEKKEISKIFESFSQIDNSYTRKSGGTGLGLVISKQLVEMMGGKLTVKSQVGVGSTFSFLLDFDVLEHNTTTSYNYKTKDLSKTTQNAKILLVEDDEVNQIVISRMLKEMGYRHDIASSGEEALKLLEYNNYDLCLMDIQMPGLDGLQTSRIIRKKHHDAGIYMPIVAITAYALQGDRERFLAAGLDGYLAKPFQITEMFILIENLVSQYGEEEKFINKYLATRVNADTLKLDNYIKNYAYKIKPVNDKIQNKINKLINAIDLGDMGEIEQISQDIKNLSVSISADRLKTLAFRIQLSARRGNQIEIVELYEKLRQQFKKHIIKINEVGD